MFYGAWNGKRGVRNGAVGGALILGPEWSQLDTATFSEMVHWEWKTPCTVTRWYVQGYRVHGQSRPGLIMTGAS